MAWLTQLTVMGSQGGHHRSSTWKTNNMFLFFLPFPFCRGEAGQLSLRCTATFVICFQLLPVVGLFTPLFVLICLSCISLHNPLILAVVFHVFCDLPVSLSQIFSVISRLSFLPLILCSPFHPALKADI